MNQVRILLGILALSLGLTAARAGEAPNLEYAVKANFLYKFGDYITWPPEALAGDTITLCIAGDDPFGRLLDDAVAGERIKGHPIALKRLTAAGTSGCHILFASGAQGHDAAKAMSGHAILTVTEGADGGGIITFVIVNNRVRFEIDQEAARVNRLDISSRLLDLAVRVHPRKGPTP